MIYLNVAARTAALKRCTAPRAAPRGRSRWTLSSPARSRALHATRTPSARQQLPIPSRPSAARKVLLRSVSMQKGATNQRRTYAVDAASQNPSTIQGTIGKGALGVEEEAQQVKGKLQAPDHMNEKEKMIFEKLDGALGPTKLEVQDISGGCGSMYGIEIVSERFRGLSILNQQRLVNEVLGEEIKEWHGVQLKTRVP